MEVVTLLILGAVLQVGGKAVPSAGRMARELYPEADPEQPPPPLAQNQYCILGDKVYGVNEVVPSDSPCVLCRCQPPKMSCETQKCVPQPGCRAIHRPNSCCPDYQCECIHDGHTYGNGERLPREAGGECKVCYCRGGEVQCSEVGCYIRDDCVPRRVPGQCCPKYDNCPPLSLEQQVAAVSSTTMPTAVNATLLVTFPTSTSLEKFSEDTEPTTSLEEQLTEAPIDPELWSGSKEDATKITVQEVIATGPKREIQAAAQENFLKENDTLLHEDDLLDHQTNPSDKTEVFRPPPVIKIGDHILFVNKGELVPEKDVSTPFPVITLVGAEGLQIGMPGGDDIATVPAKIDPISGVYPDFSIETPEPTRGPNISTLEEIPEIQNLLSQITEEQFLNGEIMHSGNDSQFLANETTLLDYTNSTELSINTTTPQPETTFDASNFTADANSTTEGLQEAISSSAEPSSTATSEKTEIDIDNPEFPPLPEEIVIPGLNVYEVTEGTSSTEAPKARPLASGQIVSTSPKQEETSPTSTEDASTELTSEELLPTSSASTEMMEAASQSDERVTGRSSRASEEADASASYSSEATSLDHQVEILPGYETTEYSPSVPVDVEVVDLNKTTSTTTKRPQKEGHGVVKKQLDERTHKDFLQLNDTKELGESERDKVLKEDEVLQKVSKAITNYRSNSTEPLDQHVIDILRDFFKTSNNSS